MSTPIHTAAQGYGNIYTPHAGSMIIQVQREMGLANRTIVLSPRKVRLLRFFNSRNGIVLGVVLLASWVVLAVQAARIPLLTARLQHLEHTAQRLDSLETTLADMQQRYNQVQRLLGPPTPVAAGASAAPASATPGASAAAAAPATASATASAAAPVDTPAASATPAAGDGADKARAGAARVAGSAAAATRVRARAVRPTAAPAQPVTSVPSQASDSTTPPPSQN